jgi:hypothetical protein|tara:strand:- start:5413 stop:5661 length:249 start_codon:yes stop_codon:yes gene_type:complete
MTKDLELNNIRVALKLHKPGSLDHAKLMADRAVLINELALECAAEYRRIANRQDRMDDTRQRWDATRSTWDVYVAKNRRAAK